jgi:hypothetical protein
MASEKQKAASRANGAKSRGPITPEGKRRSARGNVEHGMLARTVVLDGESRPRFYALMISLQEELKPETAIENLLIHKMAVAHWRLMRAWGMERSGASQWAREYEAHEAASPGLSLLPDAPTCDALSFDKSRVHLNEYEMRFDRQFTRALDRFEKFRATRSRESQQTSPKVRNEPG